MSDPSIVKQMDHHETRNNGKSRVSAHKQHVSKHVFKNVMQVTEKSGQHADGISHDDKLLLDLWTTRYLPSCDWK